ncbi:MAG: translation initiation factor IF-3, partial [Acidobacteria bacterium]|nr:translation initiation factor IF-3 [Acidobacteriota bacterium]
PVCRIMDFGKYQYQEQKRTREARKHQKVIEVKEIKFRPKVDEHDYQFKKKHIERFLLDGDKVKATIFFRGREMAHPEIGRRILERLLKDLVDEAIAENMPRQEGNTMHVILARKPGSGPKPPSTPRPALRTADAGPSLARPADAAEPVDEVEPADEAETAEEAESVE